VAGIVAGCLRPVKASPADPNAAWKASGNGLSGDAICVNLSLRRNPFFEL